MDHEEVAQANNDVAATCLDLGLVDEAVALFEACLAMRYRVNGGLESEGVAQTTVNLAGALAEAGKVSPGAVW